MVCCFHSCLAVLPSYLSASPQFFRFFSLFPSTSHFDSLPFPKSPRPESTMALKRINKVTPSLLPCSALLFLRSSNRPALIINCCCCSKTHCASLLLLCSCCYLTQFAGSAWGIVQVCHHRLACFLISRYVDLQHRERQEEQYDGLLLSLCCSLLRLFATGGPQSCSFGKLC